MGGGIGRAAVLGGAVLRGMTVRLKLWLLKRLKGGPNFT